MPAYSFTARSRAGRQVKGLRLAASEAALAPVLAAEGLFLVRAAPAAASRRARGGRFQPTDLQLLLHHLAAYLEAGVPLLAALQDFRDPARPRLEGVALDLAARLAEGQSLSQGMAAHPGLFEALHVAMVRAGEAAGRLDPALRALLALVERQDGLRARVRKATTYPLFMLALLAGIILLVCAFSLPGILTLLEEVGVPLPAVTRVFLALGRALKTFGGRACAWPGTPACWRCRWPDPCWPDWPWPGSPISWPPRCGPGCPWCRPWAIRRRWPATPGWPWPST
jgi:type IV pilus assembly protein PilC